MPVLSEELLRNANAAHTSGRLAEAESLAMRVLGIEPDNVQAHLLVGVLAGKTGRTDVSFEHLQRVIALSPNTFEALFWLSMLHRRVKNFPLALQFAERAVQLRPSDAYALNNIGMCYLDLVRLEEAAESFQQAAAIRNDMAQIFHNLGTVLYLLGRDLESAMAFDRSLALAPGSIESWLSLGQVLISQTNPEAAIVCARKALALNPRLATAHLLTASALVENSRTGEAEKHLKKAIELDDRDAKAHALLGQRLQSLGRFEEANIHLHKSIELEPRQGFAYFAYAHNNKITENDRPMVRSMERLVEEGGLPPREVDFLHYGLGRAFEGLREYDKAIRHFDEANRIAKKLKFGDAVFDRDAYAKVTNWHIRTFTKEFLNEHRANGCQSDVPIVIVGMMRSGTTLAEQMLSSHPDVGAAGEHRFWPSSWPVLYGQDGAAFNAADLSRLGQIYVENLRQIAPGVSHVTDKMPANYEYLGFIHLALPNARIIHMKRHPVDTCVSIYATPNRVPVDFAYDRANIVFAYKEYQRLMQHWRSVLPADRFIEVNYEDVVSDRRTQIERMLDVTGLKWSESVLHHEENARNVNTPSLWQVRQPIYTSSVGRWRRYEPWLGAFQELLPNEHTTT